MLLPDFAQNGTFYAFYAFYAPRVQRQTHVRVHTSRVTNFAFDTYPRKMHFERRTAQKLARTTFRVVPNCARGGGGWIKSSSSLASEASALAFGQPARFARGLDKKNEYNTFIISKISNKTKSQTRQNLKQDKIG